MSFEGFFLSFDLAAIVLSAAKPFFFNSGRWSVKKHFYEIILKSGHRPRRRCRLKVFFLVLTLATILFSGSELL